MKRERHFNVRHPNVFLKLFTYNPACMMNHVAWWYTKSIVVSRLLPVSVESIYKSSETYFKILDLEVNIVRLT